MTEALFAAALLFGVIIYVTRPFWATVGGAAVRAAGLQTAAPTTSDRFCNDCGEKSPKGSRFCGQCGKALLTLLLLVFSSLSFAQPPGMADAAGQPPHSKMQVGEIHGTLLKDGKPQAGKQVVIQVQQDGQILLTLPKTTGPKGEFVFKNIFRDPQYSYTLLTEEGGKIYQEGPLQMTAKQEVLKVRFEIAHVHSAEMNAESLPPESPRMMAQGKAPDQWQQQQMTSIVLSAIVLIILAYVFGRYQRKK